MPPPEAAPESPATGEPRTLARELPVNGNDGATGRKGSCEVRWPQAADRRPPYSADLLRYHGPQREASLGT